MSGTDRVRFQERQYLRSFDWTAEQLYHMEMRRRLNIALHLWGIVHGLDVLEGALVPGAPEQFYVGSGMAIDAFGREIVVATSYPLTDEVLRRNRVQTVGEYWLAVAYKRELTTPPAPGYRLCDVADQYTRWHESFEILLTRDDPRPAAADAPGVADPLSDDPVAWPWPVVLGKVRAETDPVTHKLTLTQAWPEQRTYVGVRAQRLVAPVASLSSATPEPNLPITCEADLLARRNLAIGEDFAVETSKVTPPPTASPFPSAVGNLKVGSDLFVRGELYKYTSATDKWLALRDYVRQLLPEVKIGTRLIPLTPSAPFGDPATGTETIGVATTLATGTAEMIAAISSVKAKGKSNLNTWRNNIDATDPWLLETSVGAATRSGNTWNFPVTWKIGPQSTVAAQRLPLEQIVVSYVAIFLP